MMNEPTDNSNFNPENSYIVRYKSIVVDAIHSQDFLFRNDMSRFKRKNKVLGICKYCGANAFYQFKNGNLCCKKHVVKCPTIKKDISKKVSGKNNGMHGKIRSKEFCDARSKAMKGNSWAKGNKHSEEWIKIQSEKVKGNKNPAKKLEVRKKISESKKGKPRSQKTKDKISKALIGKIQSKETCLKKSKSMQGKNLGKIASKETRKKLFQAHKGKILSKKTCQKMREYMLNGGAAHANSFNQSPSKPQVELYNLIKSLYPDAILNHPSLNFSIDIAIPKQMIAIEYDGSYWHDKKEIEDNKRQKKLENIGWRFLRYRDYIPTMDELKNDLQGVL